MAGRLQLTDLPPAFRAQAESQLRGEVTPPVQPRHRGLFVVPIEPMGKPRMTQRDRWAKRPVVERYYEFKDKLRAGVEGITPTPIFVRIRTFSTMPESWSQKKKDAMRGQPHRKRFDIDNAIKAIFDAIWEEDSGIAKVHAEKFWDDGNGARIELEALP